MPNSSTYNLVGMPSQMVQITSSDGSINKYPAKQHAHKVVSRLRAATGLIYLQGQHNIFMEDSDMAYPFRQRRYFYYLSGVNEPSCHMLYDIEKDHSVLYVPQVSPEKVVWFGRGSTVQEAKDKYDFDDVRWTSSLATDVSKYVEDKASPTIFLLHPAQSPPLPNQDRPLSKIDFESTTLLPAMNQARVTKTTHEIQSIQTAIDISSLAHRTVLHHITSLESEAAVEALFLAVCMTRGSPDQAYAPIIAAGTNASILHYSKDNDPLKGRSLLCMDAGGEYACYASDITRTFPLSASGWPNTDAEALYALVEEMQERCIAVLAPGVIYSDINRLAQRIGTEGLIKLGVLKLSTNDPDAMEEFINTGGIHAFFPHGLGHHIGLDVHDVGPIGTVSGCTVDPQVQADLAASSSTITPSPSSFSSFRSSPYTKSKSHPLPPPFVAPGRWTPSVTSSSMSFPLQAGMVLTVEPGIYFNRYALDHLYLNHASFSRLIDHDVLERFIALGGVRIEDDILITEDGYKVLSTKAPKGQEMLDVIRDGARCDHAHGCCPHPFG